MGELKVEGLSKDFPPVRVLDDVSMTLATGEIVGIVGENGAGKSTLLNLLCGTLEASEGTIRLDGEPIAPRNYREANMLGIWRVFQDPALIPGIPVYENLLLGHEGSFRHGGVLLARRRMIRTAQELVSRMDLDVDVRQPVYRYNTAMRQAMEVARASLLPTLLDLKAGFVLFDEPTTGLTSAEVTRLLELMRWLRSEGVGVVFVSHRLEEIFGVCDRIYVLKDGALVGETTPQEATHADLHRMMVGRARQSDYYLEGRQLGGDEEAEVVLDVRGLGREAKREVGAQIRRYTFKDVDLQVRAGELVGIGGLLGSGKSDLVRSIAGVDPTDEGEVALDGETLRGSIASRKGRGVAFVSGERREESVIGTFNVGANISLASGEHGPYGFSNGLGFWMKRSESRQAKECVERFDIRGNPRSMVARLSGGNQQKVALARWIRREPRLLIIENPTAGVDVGGKFEIYKLLRDLTAGGAAVLCITDELPELIGLSDRVLIMRDGRLAAEFAAPEEAKPTEHELVSEMIGGTPEIVAAGGD